MVKPGVNRSKRPIEQSLIILKLRSRDRLSRRTKEKEEEHRFRSGSSYVVLLGPIFGEGAYAPPRERFESLRTDQNK